MSNISPTTPSSPPSPKEVQETQKALKKKKRPKPAKDISFDFSLPFEVEYARPSEMTEAKAWDMFDLSVATLQKLDPWYGSVLTKLQPKLDWTPPHPDGTPACTAFVSSEGVLCINVFFFAPLEDRIKIGILVHELKHIIYGHLSEYHLYEDKVRANVAFDMEINPDVRYLPEFRYSKQDKENLKNGGQIDDKSREELQNPQRTYGVFPSHFDLQNRQIHTFYYERLPLKDKDLEDMLNRMGLSVGAPGDTGSGDGGNNPQPGNGNGTNPLNDWQIDQSQSDKFENNVDDIVSEVASQQRGTMPAGIEKRLEKIESKKKISWKTLFRRYAKSVLLGERKMQYKRPDRRSGWIPGRHREKKQRCIVAIDTSGSTMPFRAEFASELIQLDKQTSAEMIILECDAAVGKEYKFSGKVPETMTGGGGTAFMPVFDYVRDKKMKCSLLIYLTDGYGEHPEKPSYVNYPVIWVTTHADPAPFGKIIKMELENDPYKY